MSRSNNRKRWKAKQRQAQAEQFAQVVAATLRHGDDSDKLQRGSPSYTSTDTYAKHARLSGARDRSEVTSKSGKIVSGAFKRDTGAVKRFTVKGGQIVGGKFIPTVK